MVDLPPAALDRLVVVSVALQLGGMDQSEDLMVLPFCYGNNFSLKKLVFFFATPLFQYLENSPSLLWWFRNSLAVDVL